MVTKSRSSAEAEGGGRSGAWSASREAGTSAGTWRPSARVRRVVTCRREGMTTIVTWLTALPRPHPVVTRPRGGRIEAGHLDGGSQTEPHGGGTGGGPPVQLSEQQSMLGSCPPAMSPARVCWLACRGRHAQLQGWNAWQVGEVGPGVVAPHRHCRTSNRHRFQAWFCGPLMRVASKTDVSRSAGARRGLRHLRSERRPRRPM
jgi:hypothetical protein